MRRSLGGSGMQRWGSVGAVMGVLGCSSGCCGLGSGQPITDSTSKGCRDGDLLSFRPFCNPGGRGRSLSAVDTRGRNRCLPSCWTQPLHRCHTPLNTSLLLYQNLQLGSPVATALASNAHDADKGWEAREGLLETPA